MDKAVLVAPDVAAGERALEALDRSALAISVALWANLDEYGDWRIVLASRRLDSEKRREAYGLVDEALRKSGFRSENTPRLMILSMTDPFIRRLRQLFGKSKNVEGMRLGGQMIGDRFVDDAFVYRIE